MFGVVLANCFLFVFVTWPENGDLLFSLLKFCFGCHKNEIVIISG